MTMMYLNSKAQIGARIFHCCYDARTQPGLGTQLLKTADSIDVICAIGISIDSFFFLFDSTDSIYSIVMLNPLSTNNFLEIDEPAIVDYE